MAAAQADDSTARHHDVSVAESSVVRCSENYTWQEKDSIGQGGFGTVYEGRHRITRAKVAVKVFNADETQYKEDFKMLKRLHSLYIVRYLAQEQVRNSSEKQVLVMELADGNVREELCKKEHYFGLPLSNFTLIVDHCVHALIYLDSQKIAHRDLKPENILVFNQPKLIYKLSDFGFCHPLTQNDQLMHTILGTGPYMPSVVIKNAADNSGSSNYTKDQFDIWSAACCFFECATGRAPFLPKPGRNYYRSMKKLYGNRPPNIAYAHYDSSKKQYVYHAEMPLQHSSYSGSVRARLAQFFQQIFNQDKAFLKIEKFSELAKNLVSTALCDVELRRTGRKVEELQLPCRDSGGTDDYWDWPPCDAEESEKEWDSGYASR